MEYEESRGGLVDAAGKAGVHVKTFLVEKGNADGKRLPSGRRRGGGGDIGVFTVPNPFVDPRGKKTG